MKWKKNKLFEKQESRNKKAFKEQNIIRKTHNNEQLAKSLLSFSKGALPAFEGSFALFDFPVFLLNGHDDTKYIKLNRDMMKIHKKAKQYIINDSSHNIHSENTDEKIINEPQNVETTEITDSEPSNGLENFGLQEEGSFELFDENNDSQSSNIEESKENEEDELEIPAFLRRQKN